MTRLRIEPSAATALPGDAVHDVDLGDPDAPRIRAIGPGVLVVERDGPDGPASITALVGAPRSTATGPRLVEVVVDGWRFELEVEDAARAELRRRATRERDASNASGPLDVRAIIPGRVAVVRVAVGDQVEAGEPLLVVEAMKMQNELRSPRAGTVERVAVADGQTIEHGDLLVVLT